jgi:hypothetical protein
MDRALPPVCSAPMLWRSCCFVAPVMRGGLQLGAIKLFPTDAVIS